MPCLTSPPRAPHGPLSALSPRLDLPGRPEYPEERLARDTRSGAVFPEEWLELDAACAGKIGPNWEMGETTQTEFLADPRE